jgi:hypothetical protein
MRLPRSVQICAPLFAGVLALTFSSPALAADTAAPTAPVLVDAEGYQCLEVDVLFTRSSDTVTAQHDLMYKIYADGSFIGWSDDHGSYSVIWAAAYANQPGPSTITVTAVDAAGNESAASNALTANTDVC